MENSMSRILIETVVRKTLKDMKEDPERSIRKLVDMALNFSEGRFQTNFFQIAQTMLENESSPYYALLRNLSSSVDTERLVCFGMNLGYNSCTLGAKKIRENEQKLGCNIPWTVSFQTGRSQISEHLSEYQTAVADGERLGIYAWMLFVRSHPQALLPLIHEHPDSAFFLFCDPDDIGTAFLDSISDMNNLMLVVRYEETAEALYAQIRDSGLLYSAYYTYGQEDMESIMNGDLFYSIQQTHSVFTVLLAQQGCPDPIQNAVCQAVVQARDEQRYQTIPLEYYLDNRLIDKIISDDACSAWFDPSGILYSRAIEKNKVNCNLFDVGLLASFQSAFSKSRLRRTQDES